MMDLKYDDLKTFIEVHKAGTFTRASETLGLSQSALSQKIARIEEALQAAVFVRHPRSLSLTASGEKLLVYAKQAQQMQDDFLSDFNQYDQGLSGVLRIAGYSSVTRSMIIPKLAPFMRENPRVSLEFSSHEMFELEDVLKSNRADFIVTDYLPNLPQGESRTIAEEEYVIIRSKKHPDRSGHYLDHGPFDNATDSYFKAMQLDQNYQRLFMGDVYSIIDGVAMGLGRAVMSKHLIENDRRFVIEKPRGIGRKTYKRPVVLSYMRQNYYGPLQKKLLEIL